MKDENLIHVKLEYNEALQSKKDVLSSEINLIKILNTMKKYHSIRLKELTKKMKLARKIRETNSEVRKLQVSLPKLKIPKILKGKGDFEEEPELETEEFEEPEEEIYEGELATELQDIQSKLRQLGQ